MNAEEPKHVCGLMGYDPWLGDTCIRCEQLKKQRETKNERMEGHNQQSKQH